MVALPNLVTVELVYQALSQEPLHITQVAVAVVQYLMAVLAEQVVAGQERVTVLTEQQGQLIREEVVVVVGSTLAG
jgi:hypothetical protein